MWALEEASWYAYHLNHSGWCSCSGRPSGTGCLSQSLESRQGALSWKMRPTERPWALYNSTLSAFNAFVGLQGWFRMKWDNFERCLGNQFFGPKKASFTPWAELRNVNSFTRSKTLELNFTPRKARKSRQFWHLSQIKCAKRIVLVNKCWQIFQIRLVYTQKSNIDCANHFKIGLIWSHCVFSQTFYPNL